MKSTVFFFFFKLLGHFPLNEKGPVSSRVFLDKGRLKKKKSGKMVISRWLHGSLNKSKQKPHSFSR